MRSNRVRPVHFGRESAGRRLSGLMPALLTLLTLPVIVLLAGCAGQTIAVASTPVSAPVQLPQAAVAPAATDVPTKTAPTDTVVPQAIATTPAAALPSSSTAITTTAATTASSGITLHLAVADSNTAPTKPYVDEFVRQVNALSGGAMTVMPTFDAGGDAFEQGVIRKVLDKDTYELGLAGARAWDPLGVNTFQALQTPFLINSDELAKAVATSDIAQKMLDSLSSSGAVGLVLWPEDLRHPFSLMDGKPVLSPADFRGHDVRVTPSKVSNALVQALHGKPMSGNLGYQIAESGLLQGASLNGRPTATGNITFFPKFQSLFMNAAAFDKLSPGQQAIVRKAATAARDKALAEHLGEAKAGATWCADGGGLVNASPEQVAAFETAAEPVIATLEQNPLNKEVIARLRDLKAKTTATPQLPAPCAAVPVQAPEANGPWTSGPLPNGVWKVDLSTEDFFRYGMLRSAADSDWTGKYVMTVTDGEMSFTFTGSKGETGSCQTRTSARGDKVQLAYGPDCSNELDDVQWRLDKDGLHLHLLDIMDGPENGVRAMWEAKPWQKVQ